jgi:hypothetical protein
MGASALMHFEIDTSLTWIRSMIKIRLSTCAATRVRDHFTSILTWTSGLITWATQMGLFPGEIYRFWYTAFVDQIVDMYYNGNKIEFTATTDSPAVEEPTAPTAAFAATAMATLSTGDTVVNA